MHKLTAAAGSMVFFLAAPTMVAGVAPSVSRMSSMKASATSPSPEYLSLIHI